MKNIRPFGMRDYIGYGMGDFGCNMSFVLISDYIMLFFTQYIGVSLTDWAWIIAICRVCEAINALIIGNLVDRLRISKTNKFIPWISIGGTLLVIFTTLVFLPITQASYSFKVIYCVLSYCIWSFAYTMAHIPYGAMHSSITDNTDKRTNLSFFRNIGALLAQTLIAFLPILIYDDNESLKGDMMIWIALICSIIGFVGFMFVRIFVTERLHIIKPNHKFKYIATITACFKNRPLLAISAVSVINRICYMFVSLTNIIMFQSFFHNTKLLAVTNIIISYTPMLIIMPLAIIITKKIGKRGFIEVVTAISTIAGIIMLIIPIDSHVTSSIFIWIVGFMLTYFGNVGFMFVVYAMLADGIDYGYKKTGIKEEGSTYALFSFARKLAAGVGSTLLALLLVACGYVESLGANQTAQSALNIKNMYLIVMTVGSAISFIIIKFVYNIKENKTTTKEV